MSGNLEIAQPPEGVWVELISGLSWIRYRHSVDLSTLLGTTRLVMDKSEEEVRAELECAWRELSDVASSGRIMVRGRQVHEGEPRFRGQKEVDLGSDDCRGCRYLAWPIDTTGNAAARVERTENSFSGAFSRRALQPACDYDFVDLVVLREQLMDIWPVPKRSMVKRRRIEAGTRKAAMLLSNSLRSHDPATTPKATLLDPISEQLGLTVRQRSEAWKAATASCPEWRSPGRKSQQK
jgi:hypothetical protein